MTTFTDEQSRAILEGRTVTSQPGGGEPGGGQPGGGEPGGGQPGGGEPGGGQPGGGQPGGGEHGGGEPAPIDYATLTNGRFKTKEEFDSHLTQIDEFNQNRTRLSSALQYAEDPIPFEGIRQKVSFMRSTGITDENVAAKIVSTTEEQMKADPVLALAIQDVINNPTLLSGGLTFDDIVAGYRETYGFINNDENGLPQYEKKAALALEGAKAVQKIADVRKQQSEQPDIFAQSIQKNKDHLAAVEKARDAWQGPDVRKAVENYTFKMKLGDAEFEVAGAEQAKKATEAAINIMVSKGVDPSTPEGMAEFESTRNWLFSAANLDMIVATAVQNAVNDTQSSVKKAANQFFHNQQTIARPGVAAPTKGVSADDVAKQLIGR